MTECVSRRLVSGSRMRGRVHRKIGGGIDQQLACELWAVAIARRKRNHRGEIAAGAVAADHDPRRIDAELSGVVGYPFGGGDAVVDRSGIFVLGREAIVDGDDDQLALMGHLAADHVVGIDIADHPAAAVEEHQARREAVGLAQCLRRVDARRDRPCGAGIDSGFAEFKLGRFGIGGDAAGEIELARFVRRHGFEGRAAGLLKGLVDEHGIGIENDGHRIPLVFGMSFRGDATASNPESRDSGFGPSHRPGMTFSKRRCGRRRRCSASRRRSSLHRRPGTPRWRRLRRRGRAGVPESGRRACPAAAARCRRCGPA